ncbi:MAG: hypothetical protein PHH00_01925 [Candidatus Nanoarchaeia archaeon]|nr:hypothetical protein [Candidatus Nanoarchaeia archaeon]
MKKRKEKKVSKRIPIPKADLEKNAEAKAEIIPQDKKKTEKDEFLAELDSAEIISSGELKQILKSESKLHQLENMPVKRSLEGGLIFVPRMKGKADAGGKVYADTKYDKQYTESRYAEKTPGSYAGKETSSEKESSGSSGSSNGSSGMGGNNL